MKSKSQSVLTTVALVSGLSASSALAQGGDSPPLTFPLVPSGWLNANPTIVQTGTKPVLTWGINFPSVVTDHVTIIPPATIVTRSNLDCEIRVLGSSVTQGSFGGALQYRYTNAAISINGGAYTSIWWKQGNLVNPSAIVWSATDMPANRTLKFGGHYSGHPKVTFGRGPWFNSDSATPNVRALVSGDIPPSTLPAHGAEALDYYLRPYLDRSGRVAIGPMDVIIIMELTHTDEENVGYDMQDQVLLVTFKPLSIVNDGAGNNIKGVDSSNPDKNPFINLDTDPVVVGDAPADP